MAGVSLQDIKNLREQTQAGVMDCKNALNEADGDLAKAADLLRARGLILASKKSDRATSEGAIDCYVHTGSRVAAIVEVNCETDFVARTPEFRELVHNIAMQVAAMSPTLVEDTEEGIDLESDLGDQSSLMKQPFIKDQTMTIRDLVNEVVARVGENIRIRRFTRFSIGEDLDVTG